MLSIDTIHDRATKKVLLKCNSSIMQNFFYSFHEQNFETEEGWQI